MGERRHEDIEKGIRGTTIDEEKEVDVQGLNRHRSVSFEQVGLDYNFDELISQCSGFLRTLFVYRAREFFYILLYRVTSLFCPRGS